MPRNAFYAQSGGVTAVINVSAQGVIETARKHPDRIGKVYAGRNGIIGALTEDLIDTSRESDAAIAALRYTPSGAFGSCRHKLKGFDCAASQPRLSARITWRRSRNSLAASVSDDEGRTWKWTRHLEQHATGSYHYPAVIQGRDGTIHAVYSYFVTGGKSMKHAAFTEDWVREGDAP